MSSSRTLQNVFYQPGKVYFYIVRHKKKKKAAMQEPKLKCNTTISFTHFQCRIIIEDTIRNGNNQSHLKMRLPFCCAFHNTEIKIWLTLLFIMWYIVHFDYDAKVVDYSQRQYRRKAAYFFSLTWQLSRAWAAAWPHALQGKHSCQSILPSSKTSVLQTTVTATR